MLQPSFPKARADLEFQINLMYMFLCRRKPTQVQEDCATSKHKVRKLECNRTLNHLAEAAHYTNCAVKSRNK